MTPADIDRVFGRGRLRMVTGEHVEVFREEALPGERRRYTKRFLATAAGDFRHWTEREWRILARLVGHGIGPVPDVVQFDRGAADRPALVQTYDAGITVDHWATLLPVERDGWLLRHVFEDCAHWWALARHCLMALDAIHELQLVHLDLKADNVCIPVWPADFTPHSPGQTLSPRFDQIALIDFAFSLVSGESLVRALPIARQAEYDYQSPRLLIALEEGSRGNLAPTRQLDWRCDIFSLAAMLRRYLPDPEKQLTGAWTNQRHAQARALVRWLLEAHDADIPLRRPHGELIAMASQPLKDADLAESLQRGWTLSTDIDVSCDDSPTPVTRIALPVAPSVERDVIIVEPRDVDRAVIARASPHRGRSPALLWGAGLMLAAAISVPLLGEAWLAWQENRAAADGSDTPAHATEHATEQQAQTAGSVPVEVASSDSSGGTSIDRESARLRDARSEAEFAPASVSAAPASVSAAPASVSASPAPALSASASEPAPAAAQAHVVAKARTNNKPNFSAAAPRVVPSRGVQGSTSVYSKSGGPAQTRAVARAVTRAVTRPHERGQMPEPERARALAYLSARGPAPLSAQASSSNSIPAPAVAAASPPAPALPAPSVPAALPSPASATPAPVAIAPTSSSSLRAMQSDVPAAPFPKDFAARATEMMTDRIPRIAQRAERLVLRVLFTAEHSEDAAQDTIRNAASALQRTPDDLQIETVVAADEARALSEAARLAFWRQGNAQEALNLQLKAFGANPLDPEIVGNLAFLHLKQHPRQANAARQLALSALTMRDPRNPNGRIEDWTTLAVASALTGRDRDARSALFVALALAPNAGRQCRTAMNAYAAYGEPMRAPVEAMLYRVHSWGRPALSSFCEWPPYWTATSQAR